MEETRRLKATLAAKVGTSVARHRPSVPVAPGVEFLKPLPLHAAVNTLRAARPAALRSGATRLATIPEPAPEPASRAEPKEQRAWRDAAAQIARTRNPKPQLEALLGSESEDHREQFLKGHGRVMRERFAQWLQRGAGTDVLGQKQKQRLELAKKLRQQLQELGQQALGETAFRAVFDGQAGPCPCCATHDFLAEEQRCAGSWEQFGERVAREYRRPVMHDSDMRFDEDTSITTAVERVAFTDVPADVVARFFGGADPRNWDDSGDGEFFKSTEPGEWKAGAFRAFPKGSREYAEWCKGKPGLMQEIIEFQWSPTTESTVEATTVLTISDLVKQGYTEDEAHPLPGTKRTEPEITAAVACLSYKYSLFVSARSKYAVGTVPGGLDVDQGTFRATWTHTHDAPDGTGLGVLEVEADKSVHYTQPADAPPGLGTLLNLMAPPLTSILMRELVFEGTRKALS